MGQRASPPATGRSYLYSSPRSYADWLRRAIDKIRTQVLDPSGQLVFINAWNEWAEGAVLEPDARLGHAYLQATRSSLLGERQIDGAPHVIIHAWYLDELEEILQVLQSSALPWRLIVTTVAEKREEASRLVAKAGMSCEILVCENRGRDILPFLKVADRLINEGVDVVLKLHTKRSTHRSDGAEWLRQLLERLVKDSRGREILAAFKKDHDLGIVGPEGHVLRLGDYRGASADALENVLLRIGLPKSQDSDMFVAGSMFWIRLRSIRPLLDAH